MNIDIEKHIKIVYIQQTQPSEKIIHHEFPAKKMVDSWQMFSPYRIKSTFVLETTTASNLPSGRQKIYQQIA